MSTVYDKMGKTQRNMYDEFCCSGFDLECSFKTDFIFTILVKVDSVGFNYFDVLHLVGCGLVDFYFAGCYLALDFKFINN